MSDELIFCEEKKIEEAGNPDFYWTILIVDDEREVHAVTNLALSDFQFNGRRLHFLHAYSAQEAREILRTQNDIALVLLDVVMETETAGLSVVEYIRNELKNNFIRIVLRTGQPGQAPELEVISRYDINDYKNKTELTRTRLYTTVYTGLATYRDLIALDANRRGLEKVIEASARIFEIKSLTRFTQGVLEQLSALLFLGRNALMVHASGVAAKVQDRLEILAATGTYASLTGCDARAVLPANVVSRIEAARLTSEPIFGKDYFVREQCNGAEIIFYVGADAPLSVPDRRLIDLFCQNVAIAYRNLSQFQPPNNPGPDSSKN